MTDKPWKSSEREFARVIRGKRQYHKPWDCESEIFIGENKSFKSENAPSWNKLMLVLEKAKIKAFGTNKTAIVRCEERMGKGNRNRRIIIMDQEEFEELFGSVDIEFNLSGKDII